MARRTKKSRGTRRSAIDDRRRPPRSAATRLWLTRFGVTFGTLALTLWAGAWFFLSDADSKTANWIRQGVLGVTADMGFSVANILVEGRVNADREVLLAVLGVQKGDPLFALDPAAAKEQLERISWVKLAQVERRLPDTIYVGLQERRPLALWQKDKKLRLIDAEGQVLTEDNLKKFSDLIVVIGEEAPQKAPALLGLLTAEPEIARRVQSASWIGGRRWDMKFADGTLVQLPEEDVGLALRRLGQAHDEDGLLDRDIVSVDLREQGNIIVRTRPGMVQEYKAGLRAGDKNI